MADNHCGRKLKCPWLQVHEVRVDNNGVRPKWASPPPPPQLRLDNLESTERDSQVIQIQGPLFPRYTWTDWHLAFGCAVGDFDKTLECVDEAPMLKIMGFLLYHGPGIWTTRGHWIWNGCGQNCGCCRAHNWEDVWSGCEACALGWTLTCVSEWVKKMTKGYAKSLNKGYVVACACGLCTPRRLYTGHPCPKDLGEWD